MELPSIKQRLRSFEASSSPEEQGQPLTGFRGWSSSSSQRRVKTRSSDASYKSGDASYKSGDTSHRSSGASYKSSDASYRSGDASSRSGDASYRSGDASSRSGDASSRSSGASSRSSDASYKSSDASYRSGDASSRSGDASSRSSGASSRSSGASSRSGDASSRSSGASSRSSGASSRSSGASYRSSGASYRSSGASFDDDDASYNYDETFRLLLVGKTGSGKSTTGNTILGQPLFNTALDFGSVTAECERQVAIRGKKRIEIVDSPGLYDTSKTHEEVCTIIVQAVAGMHPGPHAVLYVIKVGRFTPEEFDSYRRLKALFDDKISRHTILLFTHGDELESRGMTLEGMLGSDNVPDNLKQVVKECGNRCLLFNNISQEPDLQVNTLLKTIRSLVSRRGGKCYSCPKYSKIGEGLEDEVNKRMEKFEKRDLQRQKYVQELQRETERVEQEAEKAREEMKQKDRQREQEVMQERKKLERVEKQLRKQMKMQQDRTERQKDELQELRDEFSRLQMMENDQQQRHRRHQQEMRDRQAKLDRKAEKLERKRQEAEKERQKEEKRRERERERERSRVKDRVVKKEEPGLLGKIVNFIKWPFKFW